MLTMFTTPKPFSGHIGIIQSNAIQSWTLLHPECEVILFGNEEGTAETAAQLKVRHIPQVERNEYGTPLVSHIFEVAQDVARYPLMCYVNADIILMGDFLPAIAQIELQSFLLIARRLFIDIEEHLDFSNPGWEHGLRARLVNEGKQRGGLDLFVFPRGMYRDMPPFAVGRIGWDNWTIYRARSLKVPVIDATSSVTVVHQSHDHFHLQGGEADFWEGREASRHKELTGNWERAFGYWDATWILSPQGVKRALSIRHLCYRLAAIPVLVPQLAFLNLPVRLAKKGLRRAKKLV